MAVNILFDDDDDESKVELDGELSSEERKIDYALTEENFPIIIVIV